MLTITIPNLPPSALSPNARVHWRVRAPIAAAAKEEAMVLCWGAMQDMRLEMGIERWKEYPNYPLDGCVVRFRYGLPDKRRRDLDNLISASKAYLDGVVASGLIRDDSHRNISLEYAWFDSPKIPLTIIVVDGGTAERGD